VENAEEETAGHGGPAWRFFASRRCHRCGDNVFLYVLFSTNMREEKIKHEQPEENRGYVLDSCHGI
jgi:hypothetical protein